MVLTPLLLQGWIPAVATFLNTPAWTMSAEALLLPDLSLAGALEAPGAPGSAPGQDGRRLAAGHGPRHALHRSQSRRHRRTPTAGVVAPGSRRSNSRLCLIWPASSSASCWPGWTSLMPARGRLRLLLGLGGFAGIFACWCSVPACPMPSSTTACSCRSSAASFSASPERTSRQRLLLAPARLYRRGQLLPLPAPLQPVEPDPRLAFLERLGLIRFDPWLSYVVLICLALLALHFVEKPPPQRRAPRPDARLALACISHRLRRRGAIKPCSDCFHLLNSACQPMHFQPVRGNGNYPRGNAVRW